MFCKFADVKFAVSFGALRLIGLKFVIVATMVVSYTDYNTALIYFCFRYRPGRKDQCQQKSLQAEIMSRSTQVKKRTVKEYLKRMQKRLCISPKDVFPTKPGKCFAFECKQSFSIAIMIRVMPDSFFFASNCL